MVGLVLVSHSNKIAEGAKEMALQMAAEVSIEAAGGTADGRIGTDVDKIVNAINKAYSEEGVLILFDLGSAVMNAEMAIEFIDSDKQGKVKIIDCALVEGAILAAVESSIGNDMNKIEEALKELKLNKM